MAPQEGGVRPQLPDSLGQGVGKDPLQRAAGAKIRSNELRGQRSAPTSCGGKDLLHELRCKDSLHELRGKSPRLAVVLADEQLTAVMCDTALALLRDAASRARSHQLHLLRVHDRLAVEAGFARGSDLQKCPAARCCGGAVAVLLG